MLLIFLLNHNSQQDQYIFIHDVVLESVTCGDTQVSAKDLKIVIKRLGNKDQITGKTQFEAQFEVCICSEIGIQFTILHFNFQVLNQVTSDPNRTAKNEQKNRTKNHLLNSFSCEALQHVRMATTHLLIAVISFLASYVHAANEQSELLIKQGLSDCVHASFVNVRCAILQFIIIYPVVLYLLYYMRLHNRLLSLYVSIFITTAWDA